MRLTSLQEAAILRYSSRSCANRRRFNTRGGTMTITFFARRLAILRAVLPLALVVALALHRRAPIAATISRPAQEPDRRARGRQDRGQRIYLSHPQAKEITLGCSGRNFSNQLYRPVRAAASPRLPFSIWWLAPPPSSSPCQRTTCSRARRAASSGWACSRATTFDALPSPRHAMHANEDRILDHDLARHRPINPAAAPGHDRTVPAIQAGRSPSGQNRPDRAHFNVSDSSSHWLLPATVGRIAYRDSIDEHFERRCAGCRAAGHTMRPQPSPSNSRSRQRRRRPRPAAADPCAASARPGNADRPAGLKAYSAASRAGGQAAIRPPQVCRKGRDHAEAGGRVIANLLLPGVW